MRDKETNLPKYTGKIQEDGKFIQKFLQLIHGQIKHLGLANTIVSLMKKKKLSIPKLCNLVKKEIRNCNIFKVSATKLFGANTTSFPGQYVVVLCCGCRTVEV